MFCNLQESIQQLNHFNLIKEVVFSVHILVECLEAGTRWFSLGRGLPRTGEGRNQRQSKAKRCVLQETGFWATWQHNMVSNYVFSSLVLPLVLGVLARQETDGGPRQRAERLLEPGHELGTPV